MGAGGTRSRQQPSSGEGVRPKRLEPPSAPPTGPTHGDSMTTRDAARYCGFRAPSGLISAFRRGKIAPNGRRGGTGGYTWKRETLDEFLRGNGPMGDALADGDVREGRPSGHLAAEGRRLPRTGSRDRFGG